MEDKALLDLVEKLCEVSHEGSLKGHAYLEIGESIIVGRDAEDGWHYSDKRHGFTPFRVKTFREALECLTNPPDDEHYKEQDDG